MPHSSIPEDMERTPDQDGGPHDLPHRRPQQGHDLHTAVDQLCRDVQDIKRALVGRNSMRPDPESLVAKVNDHDRMLKEAKWLARLAVAGVVGVIGSRLLGGH